ncbi:protein WVD2-like 4 [Cocos nucifera]|uniref:Protein WVD2-like 4 n=1 Tax=Cocos nucifera TaxID=13894 RepID=A0A8K0N3M9_COCNU|nr:protein WVD2-like 4 [Cocos nucifera]
MKSPAMKPVNSKKKPTPQTPGRTLPHASPAKDGKPINAKKNSTKGEKDLEPKKGCRVLCESPCAPEEVFIAKDQMIRAGVVLEASPVEADRSKEGIEKKNWVTESKEPLEGSRCSVVEDSGGQDSKGSSKIRKIRSMILEETMSSMPEPGAGRVMYLVKAFERLLCISKDTEGREKIENKRKVMNWALPGLQQPPKAKETEVSSSPVSSSSEFIPGKDFERDCSDHSSVDGDDDGFSWGSGTPDDGRRSRRNSTGSSGRSWNKKLKVTSQQPFKLRTEQRGRLKEEHFLKKLKEMLLEEEKQRIPVAQGLPWTTDEPEVAERLDFLEQINMEKERQRKLEEEEERWRLRKELIPRAQPMPYFDRPFIPKKSTKPKTVPKEPKFHTRPLRPW